MKTKNINDLLKKISNGALSPDEFIDEAIVKPSVMKTLSSKVDSISEYSVIFGPPLQIM